MQLKDLTDSFERYIDSSYLEEESSYFEDDCEDETDSFLNEIFQEPVIISPNIYQKNKTTKSKEIFKRPSFSPIKLQEKEQEITESYQQVNSILEFCTKHYL